MANAPYSFATGLSRPQVESIVEAAKAVTSTGSVTARTLEDRFAEIFNVFDYGAVGNQVADDTAAILAAVAAAEASVSTSGLNGQNPVVYFPPCLGYRITSSISVGRNVNVRMEAPLLAASSMGNVAALTLGEVGPGSDNFGVEYAVQVYREESGDWSDEGQIGIKILNSVGARIKVTRAEGFTIGLQCIGSGSDGFAHNTVDLGRIYNNKIGLDLNAENGGWCNQNTFNDGRFGNNSDVNTLLSRYGIRITHGDSSYNDGNKFNNPSFELTSPGGAAEAVPFLGEYCQSTRMDHPRSEGNSSTFARFSNESTDNIIFAGYSASADDFTIENDGTYMANYVVGLKHRAHHLLAAPIFNSGELHKIACHYNDVGWVNIPRCFIQSSSNANALPGLDLLTINSDYLEIANGRAVGVYVDTAVAKRFAVRRDVDTANPGGLVIRCYDAAGAVYTDASAIKSNSERVLTSTASWGGSFSGGANTNEFAFEVSAAVKKIAVLCIGSTTPCRIRSFSVLGIEGKAAAAWPGYEEVVSGANIGTAAPASGSWLRGRRIYNATPSAGGVEGWVCVNPGSPGDWKTFGSIAA